MKVVIVTTTIHVPSLLADYVVNARRFGHEQVEYIIAGDTKTPNQAKTFCEELQTKSGYVVSYLSIEDQEKLLFTQPALRQHLPYRSLSRRNVAILEAYHRGADVIITIDDDNLVQPDIDFIGSHCLVGQSQAVIELSSNTGWYNVSELLQEEHNLPVFHRGFPLAQRWQPAVVQHQAIKSQVVVNAGLWLEAPDMDAVSWIDLPVIRTVGLKSDVKVPIGLAAGTWCPFNSQNTALAREVIPAYFLSPAVGRYDDVWASLIIRRLADHLGHTITYGQPLVRQVRNSHNYFHDFDAERLGLETTGAFAQQLHAIPLTGQSYRACHGELVAALANSVISDQPAYQKSFQQFVAGQQIWHQALAQYESVPAH